MSDVPAGALPLRLVGNRPCLGQFLSAQSSTATGLGGSRYLIVWMPLLVFRTTSDRALSCWRQGPLLLEIEGTLGDLWEFSRGVDPTPGLPEPFVALNLTRYGIVASFSDLQFLISLQVKRLRSTNWFKICFRYLNVEALAFEVFCFGLCDSQIFPREVISNIPFSLYGPLA